MSKKVTLIIDTIITPYEIPRYNAIREAVNGELLVWFQAKTDKNRHWKNFPNIEFQFEVLEDMPIRISGKDIHTFHINPTILKKLYSMRHSLQEVILCGWDSASYWQTALFCSVLGIPYRVWSGSTAYEKSWRRTLFYPIIWLIIQGASRYIAYGTRARSFLVQLGADPQKIDIFYNSIDLQYFTTQAKKYAGKRQELRQPYSIPEDHFLFLFIGQCIERKGILDLCAAFAELSTQEKKCSLLIVGEGKLKEQLVKSHYSRVYFAPHHEFVVVPRLYAIADALVLPSHEEVWGLVVNEALASGVPVIAADAVGASEDLVLPDKTGYVFPAGNTAALLDRMKKIMHTHTQLSRHTYGQVKISDPYSQAQRIFAKKKHEHKTR